MNEDQTEEHIIYLLRHGESEGNARRIIQGQGDTPLTESGRNQAQALANHWVSQDMKFDRVIASPLIRARETAERIADALGNEVTLDPDWMERDFGNYSGLGLDEVLGKLSYPQLTPVHEKIGETGESEWEFYLRGGSAIFKILNKPPGKYLIVSHGGILNMALKAALGIAPQVSFQGPRFQFRNTAFAILSYTSDNQTWIVRAMNNRPHLDRE